MAKLIEHLTSISPKLRSGPSPGQRLLALVLCMMLTLGATFPGFAFAGEADSEGEGTAAPVEVPVGPPDFDPGGEETDLEEEAAVGGEEEGVAMEAEAEVGVEAPAGEEITGVATEAPVEAAPPRPVASPELATSTPEVTPVQQGASGRSEPVENESIIAPKQKRVEHSTASESATSGESSSSALAQQEAPSPQPIGTTQADPRRSLAGKNTYIVRPGDCLWHIAASLLSGSADADAIAAKVKRLWWLNEDRIGTGDPNLIYAGTELLLG